MHNIIFPSKDTTIYSKYTEINTGLDEILEITKEISSSNYFYRGQWTANTYYKRFDYVLGSSGYYYALAENVSQPTSSTSFWQQFNPTSSNENSRILIKFDLSDLDNESIVSASEVYFNLYTSIARKIPTEYTLNFQPMITDWEMGTGNYTEKVSTDGATWSRKSSTEEWSISTGGGDYSNATICSQSFNFESADVRVNIKDVFDYWNTNGNDGMIIKRPDTEENNLTRYGSLSFYSMDTHTVYLPTLEVLYDDHIYDTASFYPLNMSGSISGSLISGSIDVYMKNFLPVYPYNEKVRFYLTIKKSYQAKTFYEEARIGEIFYIDENSLKYSIKDAYSNRIMIPFSDYTNVSLDSTGHYFDVILSGFMPDRFYKMIFKYTENGVDQYFDKNVQFKVVKQ